MSDLDLDTAVVGTDGTYHGTMSRDWEIWGPQGGYLASFALRAAGLHCGLPRPASLVGHFLGVASFDAPLTITCESLRVARTAHSVRASITQGNQRIFEAMIWGVNDGLIGLTHQDFMAPDVPAWHDCPTVDERLTAMGEARTSSFRFWDNFDERPTRWRDDWMQREPQAEPPVWHTWLKYTPTATFPDPWVDACRLLVLVDVGSWPAVQAHHNTPHVIAPSIDLACEFHRIDPQAQWLLVQGLSPRAYEGLVASHQQVWDEHGTLLASGISQLLCRPVRN